MRVPQAHPVSGKTLLTLPDHTLNPIDHQSQIAFATKSIDAVPFCNRPQRCLMHVRPQRSARP